MDCVAIHTNLRYLRLENFVSQRAVSDHPYLKWASILQSYSRGLYCYSSEQYADALSFSYLIYMMNAFLLFRNKTYHEHSLTSVIQDTTTLVMDVWQELEWTDPRLTWDDEPQNLRLPMSEIWTPDFVLYNR
jgi:hypothetical protein